MRLAALERRIVAAARASVEAGDFSERSLARSAGLSQPHIHNVLKGARRLTIESADRLLAALPPHAVDYPVSFRNDVGPNERLKRLATHIDTLIDKDEARARHEEEIHALRARAAADLHAICDAFVSSVNALLVRTSVTLDPPEFSPVHFANEERGLFQINVRGRLLQINFAPPDELVSTEHFRVPYILEGTTRCFNQDLLERDVIEEQHLFYCLERQGRIWRYFDGRTYHSGLFDALYLTSLMERLV